ncbi:MAG: alpha/beta hydrolase fold domain-containing protein [Ilumatobacter sp.]
MNQSDSSNGTGVSDATDVDVVVVGAGMAGLYLMHRFREKGISARAFETGSDVGGTWYWNRYPGARCDIQSLDYQYTFDADLATEWTWSERYATQPEILAYLQFVADKHDLRRDITFDTRIDGATWNDDSSTWSIRTDGGEVVNARHYVMATGCLSAPKHPDSDGADTFEGNVYFTSRWPHEGVDFTGRRVGVIGTGSSGIQSIPLIAKEAAALTVFQRTPNFSIPARNGAPFPDDVAAVDADPDAYRQEARLSSIGVPNPIAEESALDVDDDERQRRYEAAWQRGTILDLTGAFNDTLINPVSNEHASEFVRSKIRATVDDPDAAELLCPTTFPIATKRLCLDSGYYETFNEEHVSLVDLRRNPIEAISATGIDTAERFFEFDDIVFATGFDAMTGAIVAVDIAGRDGVQLADRWADGPLTYLGLMTVGFPNLFMITGPQSPSVLSNMAVSIEQHVEWVTDTIEALRDDGLDVIEPTLAAEQGWVQHSLDFSDITLFPQADSWYVGANVPGKARVVMPYVGGVGRYRETCDQVVDGGYLGFRRAAANGSDERVDETIVCRLQPDCTIMLETMAEMGVPPIDSLPVPDARALMDAMGAGSPAGPDVGEVVDGMLPGAGGDLSYRLFRPESPGPHPIVAYFHGGGWVLGHATSDEAFCRELTALTDAIVVSVDYRHAPEARFPAAIDDAIAATAWLAANASELGGIPGQLVVAGWSAGANLAAVVAQDARSDGPAIAGQLLITPVTDGGARSASYDENADGYVLTRALMDWFWDHYADRDDRADPKASPLRAENLAGLPPAVVVTAEFDPLRDEGDAYAAAMADAGVEVAHIRGRGQIHTSITATNAIISSGSIRADIAAGVREFFSEIARV